MKVLQLGFGAVGRENVRQLLNKRHHIVAIVDTQDVLDSIDFSEFEFGKAPLPLLNSSLSFCLEETQPDVILQATTDRKSTRLNSSHVRISYAVFCLKKKKKK